MKSLKLLSIIYAYTYLRKDIIMDWNAILSTFVNGCITVAWRLVLSLFIFIIGRLFIKFILKKIKNSMKSSTAPYQILYVT